MFRADQIRRGLGLAPFVLAGTLFLGGEGPIAAQETATPAPVATEAESTEQTAAPAAETPAAVGSEAAPTQVPRTGVGLGPETGGPMVWGALAGAAVAAAAALRERAQRR